MLQDKRREAGLSQDKFAIKCGIGAGMIRHYEQGSKNVNRAKLETLVAFCEALNCKLSDILTDEKLVAYFKKRGC